jgi:hypothetical protein
MTGVGCSSDDSYHGITDCFLPRSRLWSILFSLEAIVHLLRRLFANEIMPARAVVVAAATAVFFSLARTRP